jgi:hypothetical protein
MSGAEIVRTIGRSLQPDAIFFLDTNVFTRKMDKALWDMFLSRQVRVASMVWKELLPWMQNPFANREIRDIFVNSVRNQIAQATGPAVTTSESGNGSVIGPTGIEVVLVDDQYIRHGYYYFLELLGTRKQMGIRVAEDLERKLGRPPRDDEFLSDVQRHLGERGFQLAKKGKDAKGSPNLFSDEETVVVAWLTAITPLTNT